MALLKKGKGNQGGGAPKGPAFNPIDRVGLLGLLDQVVNGGQSGVLELREPRGNWVYAFQAGALTHASGGRVRGARQAFDLLWEFQSGEFSFAPGPHPGLAGNLYIDKGRLLDLLRRSQAVLQGPSAPYIPPDQQRLIAPPNQPYRPPVPGQMPTWQPAAPPGQYPVPPPQGWPAAGQPGMPPAPAWGYPDLPAAGCCAGAAHGRRAAPARRSVRPPGQPGRPGAARAPSPHRGRLGRARGGGHGDAPSGCPCQGEKKGKRQRQGCRQGRPEARLETQGSDQGEADHVSPLGL